MLLVLVAYKMNSLISWVQVRLLKMPYSATRAGVYELAARRRKRDPRKDDDGGREEGSPGEKLAMMSNIDDYNGDLEGQCVALDEDQDDVSNRY